MKNEMYGVLKNVISTKNYELSDMLKKIKTLWAQSDITDEQYTSLILDAQNNARTENSIDVLKSLYDLNRRVKELEEIIKSKIESGEDGEGENDGEEVVTYPEYVPGDFYYNGSKITVDGKNYICTAPEGAVCVWSPSEYPAYWIDYEDEPLTEEDALLTE